MHLLNRLLIKSELAAGSSAPLQPHAAACVNAVPCCCCCYCCCCTQGIFQGLYFGVGQGLGALIGGLLKQRHGGQAMFALCSCIVLAGWLLCVLAEQAITQFGTEASDSSKSSSSSSRSPSRHWWLRRQVCALLCKLRGLFMTSSSRSDGSSGVLTAAGSSRAQWRQQKYAELASKDSGPDLQQHLQGILMAGGDRAGV
jgi:hypothetical protein